MRDLVTISKIFEVYYGVNLELVNLDQCNIDDPDAISFVSRTENNNGVSAIVKRIKGVEPNPAHTISVAGGGSVLSSFYQPHPYYSGRDLYYLTPKIQLNPIEMLFYAYCIELNKYKYNYGRQANRTLRDILIPSYMPNSFRGLEKNIITKLGDISNNVLSIQYKTEPQPLTPREKRKALTDEELVQKYESGGIDLNKTLKPVINVKK